MRPGRDQSEAYEEKENGAQKPAAQRIYPKLPKQGFEVQHQYQFDCLNLQFHLDPTIWV